MTPIRYTYTKVETTVEIDDDPMGAYLANARGNFRKTGDATMRTKDIQMRLESLLIDPMLFRTLPTQDLSTTLNMPT